MDHTNAACAAEFDRNRPGSPPAWLIVGLALTFWLILAAVSPGGLPLAGAVLGTGLVLFGVGQVLVWALAPGLSSPCALLLGLPVGMIVVSGLAQLAFCQAFGLDRLAISVGVVAACGGLCAVRHVRACWRARLPLGWWFLGLTVLIGLLYYLPRAQQDGVATCEGGWKWGSPDAAFHEAISAVIAKEPPPLRNPGIVCERLRYHSGRHAMAATVSRVTGLSIGDALARAAFWLATAAVFVAAAALGLGLLGDSPARGLAALCCPAVMFLATNPLDIVADLGESGSRRPQHLLPWTWITGELSRSLGDGYFSHFFGSGSALWAGLVVVTAAALAASPQPPAVAVYRNGAPLAMLLGILGTALNGVAGLLAAAGGGLATLLPQPRRLQTWLVVGVAAALAYGYLTAAGLREVSGGIGEDDNIWGTMAFRLIRYTNLVVLSLVGIRALGLLELRWSRVEGRSFLLGLLAAAVLLQLALEWQGYPFLIAMCALAAFAGAPLARLIIAMVDGGSRWVQSAGSAAHFFCWVGFGGFVLAVIALPVAWYPAFRRGPEGIYGFAVVLLFATFVGLTTWLLARRVLGDPLRARKPIVVGASIVLLLSLAGLIRLHFAWGWDWTDNSVALDAGRAQSLRLLADRLKQGSVLATTHHYVDVPKLPARSYQYAALARSYMLLEGWEYGMRDKRLLTAVQTDNETLFTTTDPEEARGIIDKYNVTHVLVEPGESLGFASDQVDWLRRIALGGTLTVYEVVRKEER